MLSKHKTYKTRDGSRTGIRVGRIHGASTWTWREVGQPHVAEYVWQDNGHWYGKTEHEKDLIEEFIPQPFSYDACPVHEDGRRRAVTRDGREVVLLCGDAPALPIIGFHANGGFIGGWEADGSCSVQGMDLRVPPPPKRVVWVNVWRLGVDGCIAYETKDEADNDERFNMSTRLGNRAHRIEIER